MAKTEKWVAFTVRTSEWPTYGSTKYAGTIAIGISGREDDSVYNWEREKLPLPGKFSVRINPMYPADPVSGDPLIKPSAKNPAWRLGAWYIAFAIHSLLEKSNEQTTVPRYREEDGNGEWLHGPRFPLEKIEKTTFINMAARERRNIISFCNKFRGW